MTSPNSHFQHNSCFDAFQPFRGLFQLFQKASQVLEGGSLGWLHMPTIPHNIVQLVWTDELEKAAWVKGAWILKPLAALQELVHQLAVYACGYGGDDVSKLIL